jgi:hypothetical protein
VDPQEKILLDHPSEQVRAQVLHYIGSIDHALNASPVATLAKEMKQVQFSAMLRNPEV